jgi:carbamate kinase
MRVLVAIGGDALVAAHQQPAAGIQRDHVRRAAVALAPLAADHQLIVCHGNSTQVGLLAIESNADPQLTNPYPLDVLGAETQGMIGYWFVQELHNAGAEGPIAGLITQTVVDAHDPAFDRPTTFIGPPYQERFARAIGARHGWTVAAEGTQWRRVVPSPRPLRVVETDIIRGLLDRGTVVVCGGGGGSPVVESGTGALQGVEAVVDKDLMAAELALALDADRLVLLTDAPGIMRDYGTLEAGMIDSIDVNAAGGVTLGAGSIGPKIDACVRFTRASGFASTLGALEDATEVLAGRAGTTIVAAR